VAAADPIVAMCLQRRDYTTISCGLIDDALAVRALERYQDIMRRNLAIVRGNLAILDDWVRQQPHVAYVKPSAGTTALLRYDLPLPSAELCEGLMRPTGTLLTPGSRFGVAGTMRIGYANATETLRQGLGQLGGCLAHLNEA
jgi:aspartate/methionine/tyrosine aminotransferase